MASVDDHDAASLVTVLPDVVPSARAASALRPRVWVLPQPDGSTRTVRQPVLTADVDTLWFYAGAAAAVVPPTPERPAKRPRKSESGKGALADSTTTDGVDAAAAGGAGGNADAAAPALGRKRSRATMEAVSPPPVPAIAPASLVASPHPRPAQPSTTSRKPAASTPAHKTVVAHRMALHQIALRFKTAAGGMVCPRCGEMHTDEGTFKQHMMQLPCVRATEVGDVVIAAPRWMLKEAGRRGAGMDGDRGGGGGGGEDDDGSGGSGEEAGPRVGNTTASLEDRVALFQLARRYKTSKGTYVCVRCGEVFPELDAFRDHMMALPCVRESQLGDIITVVPAPWLRDIAPKPRRQIGDDSKAVLGRPRKSAASGGRASGRIPAAISEREEEELTTFLQRHPAADWPAKDLVDYAIAPWQLWRGVTKEEQASIQAASRAGGPFHQPWHRMLVFDGDGQHCVMCPLCSRTYTTLPGLRYHIGQQRCPALQPAADGASVADSSDEEDRGRGAAPGSGRWVSSALRGLTAAIMGTHATWVLPPGEESGVAAAAGRLRDVMTALAATDDVPALQLALRCARSSVPLPAHVWRRHLADCAQRAFSSLPRAALAAAPRAVSVATPVVAAVAVAADDAAGRAALSAELSVVDALFAPHGKLGPITTSQPLWGPGWGLDVLPLPAAPDASDEPAPAPHPPCAALVAVSCHASPRLAHAVNVSSSGKGRVQVWIATHPGPGAAVTACALSPWLDVPHDGDSAMSVSWCPHATDCAVLALAKMDGGVDVHVLPLPPPPPPPSTPGAAAGRGISSVTSPPALVAKRHSAGAPAVAVQWSPVTPGELWVGYGDGVVGVYHALDARTGISTAAGGSVCHPTYLLSAVDARSSGVDSAVVAMDIHPALPGVCAVAMRGSVAVVDVYSPGNPTATLLTGTPHRLAYTSVAWAHRGVSLMVGDELGNVSSLTCSNWRAAPLLSAASPVAKAESASAAPVWDICDASQQPAGSEAVTLGDSLSAWVRSNAAAQHCDAGVCLLTAHGDGGVGLHAFLFSPKAGFFQSRGMERAAGRAAWRRVIASHRAAGNGKDGGSKGGPSDDRASSADTDAVEAPADSDLTLAVPLVTSAQAGLHGVTAFIQQPVPPIAPPAGLPMLPLPLVAAHRSRIWPVGPRDGAGASAAAVVFTVGGEGVLRAHAVSPRQHLSHLCGVMRVQATAQRIANAAFAAHRKAATRAMVVGGAPGIPPPPASGDGTGWL